MTSRTKELAKIIDDDSVTGQMVNNGAIVESGSNSDGEFVRWESGLQACWDDFQPNPNSTSFQEKVFPIDFLTIPLGGSCINRQTGSIASNHILAMTRMGMGVRTGDWTVRFTEAGTADNFTIVLFAIGYYK